MLIKASGDVSRKFEPLQFSRNKAKTNYVVYIPGGSTKISALLKAAGYKIRYDKKHGRITKTWKERKIQRDLLEKEEKRIQDKFVGAGVFVKAPFLEIGSVLCPINGDNLVKALYLGFDQIYVFTLKKRIKDKVKIFADYPKVKIIGI